MTRADFDERVTIAQARMLLERAGFEARLERKLGSDNCAFELFDLGTQLGVCYTNPETKRRWAARIRFDADAAVIDQVAAVLMDRTNA
jgi:hypothetical protein